MANLAMIKQEETKVFLNTWGAYNDGCIGYGWMTADEARDFIEDNEERDGGEWFIADIDNYLGVDFGNLDYCNVVEILDEIEELEALDDYEVAEVVARQEAFCEDIRAAIDNIGRNVFRYDMTMDEVAEQEADEYIANLTAGNKAAEALARYFNYEAFARDLAFDYVETSTGVISHY